MSVLQFLILLLSAASCCAAPRPENGGCKAPEILNGFLKTPKVSYDLGSYAEFECNKDYVKNIPTGPKCEKGQWTDQPLCYNPCKVSPEDLNDSNIQLVEPETDIDKTYVHGTELEVSCKPRFRRPNQQTFIIDCYDGKFKYFRCFSGRICRISQEALDGNKLQLDEVHNNDVFYNFGETIKFKCQRGFRHPDRQPTGTCTAEEISYPKCTEITCNPPDVAKGKVEAKKAVYKEGEEIDVSCDDGFTLQPEPNKPRKCTINGWVPAPFCVSKKCDRPDIKNGYPYYSYWFPKSPGSYIDYRCNQYYLSHQKEYWGSLLCTNFGWNPEPKCFRQCSYQKAHVENAEVSNLQSIYIEGDEVEFTCKSAFRTPDGKTSGIRTCLPDGEFTTAKCSKPCSAPPLLHGKYIPRKNEFANGEYLQYECDKGYMTERRHLLATSQCLDGQWSEIPKCIAITCEQDSSLYRDEYVISYTCPHGKRAKSDLVQCFYYGWGPQVICQEVKPGQPDATNPPPDNIEKEGNRQKCPLAHSPKNAEIIDIKEAYYSNDQVTMKCNKGYRMYGSATIRCIAGKWEQPPECYEIRDQCGSAPTIQFGDTIEMRKFSYRSGEFVEYQCQIYHALKGQKFVKCLNGVWEEAPVCLEPCTATEDRMDENNIQLNFVGEKKIYLTHGEELEFKCIFGYEALPNTQMRIACKHGKLEYPNCLRKGFCILQQQKMIDNNIIYNESPVVERGQTIKFQCNEAMIPENGLEATCRLGNIQYPKCTAAKS